MKTQKSKTSAHVKFNTIVLILAAGLFFAIGVCGAQRLQIYANNMRKVSDAPGLCFDSEIYQQNGTIEQAFPCRVETDEDGEPIPADTQNEQTIFLYDHATFMSSLNASELQVVILTISSIFSMASFIAAIVYWNHNRAH